MSATKKRRRTYTDPDATRLTALVELDYDRTAIDELVTAYASSAGPSEGSASGTNELICCPRSYEEEFLHEPIGNERPCARDGNCEGLCIQGTEGFLLREFIYPGASLSDSRQLCLLCRRLEISKAYYKYETGQKITKGDLRISRHYNLVGINGEYDVRDCIVSSGQYSGLLLPVVLHVRSAYTRHMIDGVQHLTQSRMRCPGRKEATEMGGFLGRRAGLVTKPVHSDTAPEEE